MGRLAIGRARHAGWAVSLMVAAVACNGILAIEELPRGTAGSGTGGPLFDYAEGSCALCMETSSCKDEEDACYQAPGCRALYTCRAACERDDVGCRYACEDTWWDSVDAQESLDLDNCRRVDCLSACFGDGGLVWGLFDKPCRDCIDETCATQARACVADAKCERAFGCYSDRECSNPNCVLECYYDIAEANHADTANDFEACWGNACSAKCPSLGYDWACVDDGYKWGGHASGPFVYELGVKVAYGDETVHPAEGVAVQVCSQTSCGSAEAVGADGQVQLQVTPLPGFDYWSGYFGVDGSLTYGDFSIFPQRLYLGRPITRAENRVGAFVILDASVAFVAQELNTSLDPELGHVTVIVRDCLWQPAPGVELALEVPGESVAFYVEGGKFVPAGLNGITDRSGGGGFLNVALGEQTVIVRRDGIGEVARIKVMVDGGVLSSAMVFPETKP